MRVEFGTVPPADLLQVLEVGGVVLASIVAAIGVVLTFIIHRQQVKLSRQQMFIPISEKLSSFRSIDIADPNWDHVVNGVNLLELVVLVRRKQMVDEEMLLSMYGELFIQIFDEIYLARDLQTGFRRGQAILRGNTKGVVEFYKSLCETYGRADLTKSSITENTGE